MNSSVPTPSSSTDTALTKPTCFACMHFYITFDARHPYACRAHQFKCKRLPQDEVRDSSGLDCLLFEPKPRRRG